MNDLIKWRPTSLFSSTLENLFDDYFPSVSSMFGDERMSPDIEIKETDEKLIVRAELPGMTRDDISVELNDSILTLSGEKKIEKTEEKEKFHRTEISYGSFRRSFQVPMEVDAENIDANFKDGILTIDIPKVETSKPQKIEVK